MHWEDGLARTGHLPVVRPDEPRFTTDQLRIIELGRMLSPKEAVVSIPDDESRVQSKFFDSPLSRGCILMTGILQLGGLNISFLFSGGSLLVSLGVLTIYVLQYNQQERQLEDQRRQLANQEEQLDAQRTQLEKQEQELEELARQTELAEIEHKIYVEVEDFEFEGDRVVVLLSNYGNGVAKNLRLQTTVGSC